MLLMFWLAQRKCLSVGGTEVSLQVTPVRKVSLCIVIFYIPALWESNWKRNYFNAFNANATRCWISLQQTFNACFIHDFLLKQLLIEYIFININIYTYIKITSLISDGTVQQATVPAGGKHQHQSWRAVSSLLARTREVGNPTVKLQMTRSSVDLSRRAHV